MTTSGARSLDEAQESSQTPVSLAGQALPCIYSTCRSNPEKSGRLITIEFDRRLNPHAYAAVVFACWAALVAGGYSQHAVIRPDASATDQQLADVLEDLIASSRWGW
jgi:hypothetical protein